MKSDIHILEVEFHLKKGETHLDFELPSIDNAPQSFGTEMRLLDPTGHLRDIKFGAVDVLEKWTDFPRYGFLTNFSPGRGDIEPVMTELAAYHINGIQFYDWQYRHDQLLPPHEDYLDALGRQLSLQTVKGLIAAAHDRGMAAMPYLAIYAASLSFWMDHPDWRMFDVEGNPLKFEDFLGLVNPAPDSPWIDHLIRECNQISSAADFDGFHIDQYGEPRTAYDAQGQPIDLPGAFTSFIARLKKLYPTNPVVFNAVANWPIEALARSQVDFVYIEIWPPDCSYRDLDRITQNARAQSGGKPVVIALYLDAEWIVNVRLANAVIMANGGSRIEIGENGRLLSDPYFPKHQARSAELTDVMQRYQDFFVRYGQILGPTAENITLTGMRFPEETIGTVRKNGYLLGINLINFLGLKDPRWDEVQFVPQSRQDVPLVIPVSKAPESVWFASPDADTPTLQRLPTEYVNGKLHVRLPDLTYWSMVLVKFANEVE
jgi:dextranase